jgi:hypothetical protein
VGIIEKHFEEHGAGSVKVRLLSDRETGKSRGMVGEDLVSKRWIIMFSYKMYRNELRCSKMNLFFLESRGIVGEDFSR